MTSAAALFAVFCLFAACHALAVPNDAGNAIDLCHGLDCPTFTILDKTQDWELRRYDATKWVAVNGTAMTRDSINREMFFNLFAYISGENVEGVKIDMTAPVVTKVIHGAGPNCESDFIKHFMLPHEFWANPIQPTDPKVYITETPAMDVYVKTFGGFAEDGDYIQALAELSASLAASGLNVEDKYFYQVGYDSPYTFTNRHNEVWIAKQ